MFDATCGDDIIRWDNYNQEIICARFAFKDWQKIVNDINTDEEWQDFLSEYDFFVKCYILKDVESNDSIGFVYLYKDSIPNRIVSIHGGGWDRSMRSSLLYYRGMIILINNLLNNGFKIHTSCLIGNTVAYRFLHSIGFVKYYSSTTHIYMWINEKRLKSTSIYKRFRESYK